MTLTASTGSDLTEKGITTLGGFSHFGDVNEGSCEVVGEGFFKKSVQGYRPRWTGETWTQLEFVKASSGKSAHARVCSLWRR